MRIFFHGAARTVTGSPYLLEISGQRLLLERGLYQGRRAESFDRNHNLPFEEKFKSDGLSTPVYYPELGTNMEFN